MRATVQTEPKATRTLVDHLAARLPSPVDVTKHADQFTSGIPDVTVACNGFTTWLECKMLKPGKSLDSELGDDQLTYCRRLEGATRGRAWILVWDLRRGLANARTVILAPSLIVADRRAVAAGAESGLILNRTDPGGDAGSEAGGKAAPDLRQFLGRPGDPFPLGLAHAVRASLLAWRQAWASGLSPELARGLVLATHKWAWANDDDR
jgi:hypothetical protein